MTVAATSEALAPSTSLAFMTRAKEKELRPLATL